jgi:ApaG protein
MLENNEVINNQLNNKNDVSDKYNIAVNVSVQYIKEQSLPANDRYVFAYTINILNRGTVAVKLLSRHWLITDAEGKVQEVRGSGVVGEHPDLKPGEDFTYTSGAIIETPVGSMQGSYQMQAGDGTTFDAEIAAFSLAQPNILH